MASVFVGEHTVLGNRVAIKLLHKRHLDNPAIERRFFNEAKVVASIRHPNIVEILDFGRGGSGAAYIAMELLEGQTLRSRIRRGIMPERQSMLFMRQLASALSEAHAMGVVHRDLKPDNIFLVRDEEVELGERIKLLDFGIAKRIDPDALMSPASEQTATGILVGTPAYMSPEQCKGLGEIDGRSDMYSLGVVLYRMLTNQLPFEAKGTGELIGKHLYVEPESLREINPEISPGLEDVVMRCLQKEPVDRFQTMSELSNAFAELISPDATKHVRAVAPADELERLTASAAFFAHGPPPEEISATTLRTATGEQLSPAYLESDERGRNWPLWTAIGCIAAMLIGIIALSSGGDGPGPESAEQNAKAATRPAHTPSNADVLGEAASAERLAREKAARQTSEREKSEQAKATQAEVANADEAAQAKATRAKAAQAKAVRAKAVRAKAAQTKAALAARRRAESRSQEERRREADRRARQEAAARAARQKKQVKKPEKKQVKKPEKKPSFDEIETPMVY